MDPCVIRLRLPDGEVVEVGPEAIIGRSAVATVRIADPRVSTVHAEVSWRAEGPMLLARGGRLLVGCSPSSEVLLAPGVAVALAPGVEVVVEAVDGCQVEPIPATAGRARLAWTIGPATVDVRRAGALAPVVALAGASATIVAALLRAGGPVPWDALAGALWPDEAAIRARGATGAPDDWTAVDERRWRNRFDQALHALRRQLEPARGARTVTVRGGAVRLDVAPGDEVVGVTAPTGRPESP